MGNTSNLKVFLNGGTWFHKEISAGNTDHDILSEANASTGRSKMQKNDNGISRGCS